MAFLVSGCHVCGVFGRVVSCGNAGITRSDEWSARIAANGAQAAACVFAGGLGLVGTGHITVVESPYVPTGEVLDIASPAGNL